MQQKTNAQAIATYIVAIENCKKIGNTEWYDRWSERLKAIMDTAPSGGGIDNGTQLDSTSGAGKLIFLAPFHHMNDAGMYDGWTDHRVVVRPAFDGIDVTVTGRNRNQIKDYLGDVFHEWLTAPAPAETA